MHGLSEQDAAVKIKKSKEKKPFDSLLLPKIKMLKEILLMLCSWQKMWRIVLLQRLYKLIRLILFYCFHNIIVFLKNFIPILRGLKILFHFLP